MSRTWRWIFGILIALILVAWLGFGRSDRQAYRVARGAVAQRVQISQERIDLAVQMASKSVDLALMMAGNLPSQQAEADLVKQDIEEIGRRLKEAAEAQGDLAMAKLDASIEQFNKTLETVDDASKKAEDPAVKSTLDRIYGILESVKEQLVGAVLNTQQ
jgi:biopolymer transport protein ExbB/TolQ